MSRTTLTLLYAIQIRRWQVIQQLRLLSQAKNLSSQPVDVVSVPSTPPINGENEGKSHSLDACGKVRRKMADFARLFKKRRIALGYTQDKVLEGLESVCQVRYSQGHLSKFESSTLSLENMQKLRPVFSAWLDHIEGKTNISEPSPVTTWPTRRLRRTNITRQAKEVLERSFLLDRYPSQDVQRNLSDMLGVPYHAITNWFSNR